MIRPHQVARLTLQDSALVDSCLVWLGSRTWDGYGTYRDLDLRKTRKVARGVWELHNGPISDGLFVLHTCDNPACARIEHLFLGTHRDNMRDMSRKGHHASTRDPAKQSTLEEVDVVRIRYLLLMGVPQRELALQFKVTAGTISHIKNGRSWKWLKPTEQTEVCGLEDR